HEVKGIGQKRIKTIVASWDDQKEISHIMVFLQDKGINPAYATKIYQLLGKDAVQKMKSDPEVLTFEDKPYCKDLPYEVIKLLQKKLNDSAVHTFADGEIH